jgi:mono/diheme cytochrome c family protein
MFRLFLVLILFSLLAACEQKTPKETESALQVESKKETPTPSSDLVKGYEALTPSIDPAKGKAVYYANCTSCHNYNPKKVGSIGPDIYGSSIELLKNKVLYGKYPKNYQPKRIIGVMPLYPHLNNQISNLHAFLNSTSK